MKCSQLAGQNTSLCFCVTDLITWNDRMIIGVKSVLSTGFGELIT